MQYVWVRRPVEMMSLIGLTRVSFPDNQKTSPLSHTNTQLYVYVCMKEKQVQPVVNSEFRTRW